MNAQQYLRYIAYPTKLGIHEEIQLRGLLKEYPYFQSAQSLLARCLKNMDNYTFEKQLRVAAVYAPNRAVLYSLLKKNIHAEKISETEIENELSKKENLTHKFNEQIFESIEEAIIENIIEHPSSEIFNVEKKNADSIEIIDENRNDLPEKIAEQITITEEPVIENSIEIPIEKNVVQQEIIEEIVIVNTTIEEIKWEELTDEQKKIEKGRLAIEKRYREFKTGIKETSPMPEVDSVEQLVVRQIPNELVHVDKTQEIQHKKNIEEENEIIASSSMPAEKEISQTNEDEIFTEKHAFAHWLGKFKIAAPVEENKKKLLSDSIKLDTQKPAAILKNIEHQQMSTDEILENFMKQNPTISRPKAEFFNPEKIAKKSIEEDEELATETLAKITEQQGSFKKAIRMYEKLMLKNPDKSNIFAARIQKIKQENNLE